MSLLPSKPEASQPDDAEPRVVGVDSDDAEDVISALSSETARKLLAELHEEPAPPSELSDRVDTSLQNTQYHLEKLEAAGAVSVVETAYSAKGREMEVYAPADQPLVIFAGNDEKTTGLKAALSRLLGGAGLLALGSVVVQSLYGDTRDAASAPVVPDGGGNGNGGGNGGDGGGVAAPAEDEGGVETTQDGTEASGGNGGDAPPVEEEGAVDGDGGMDDSADGGYEADPDATPEPEVTVQAEAETFDQTREASENVTLSNVNESGNVTVDPENASNVSEPITTVTPDPGPQTTETAVQATDAAAGGLEPGLVFFFGGALMLAMWLVVWYVQQ